MLITMVMVPDHNVESQENAKYFWQKKHVRKDKYPLEKMVKGIEMHDIMELHDVQ